MDDVDDDYEEKMLAAWRRGRETATRTATHWQVFGNDLHERAESIWSALPSLPDTDSSAFYESNRPDTGTSGGDLIDQLKAMVATAYAISGSYRREANKLADAIVTAEAQARKATGANT